MLHLWMIPVYILAYFTGARTMFWLLTRTDLPRITDTKYNRSTGVAEHPVNLEHSRMARVIMSFLWVPLIIVSVLVSAGAGVYVYVTKPMVTPAEHAEKRRRRHAEIDAAVKQAEHELATTRTPRPGSWVMDDGPCECSYCNGRSGVHGDEAVALHNARVAAHISTPMNPEEYH